MKDLIILLEEAVTDLKTLLSSIENSKEPSANALEITEDDDEILKLFESLFYKDISIFIDETLETTIKTLPLLKGRIPGEPSNIIYTPPGKSKPVKLHCRINSGGLTAEELLNILDVAQIVIERLPKGQQSKMSNSVLEKVLCKLSITADSFPDIINMLKGVHPECVYGEVVIK